MPSTRWVDHLTPLDAEVDGRQQPVYVTADFDGNVGIDVSADVAAGAELSTVATHLRRMPTDRERDYADADELLMDGPDVTGQVIAQRIAGLTSDRAYRLQADFGPAGNRRSASVVIYCVEGGLPT